MKEYLKRMMSSSAMVSFSRNGSGFALIVCLFLDVLNFMVAWHAGTTPRLPTRDEWVGQALFVPSLYGAGKACDTIRAKFAPDVPADTTVVIENK